MCVYVCVNDFCVSNCILVSLIGCGRGTQTGWENCKTRHQCDLTVPLSSFSFKHLSKDNYFIICAVICLMFVSFLDCKVHEKQHTACPVHHCSASFKMMLGIWLIDAK